MPEGEGVGGLLGVVDEDLGNLWNEYGEYFTQGYNLIQDFSFEELLTGVCDGVTQEDAGQTVEDVACGISDTYQDVTYMFENYETVLSGWGKNLATDFLQYDLGLGSQITRDELNEFSQRLEAAILKPEDSGDEILDVVGDIALEKIELEAQNAANAPEGTPERKFHDALAYNPLLRRANDLLGVEKADNIVAQGRSLANAVEAGNVAEKVLESTTINEIDQKYRKDFVPAATDIINAVPTTRAAVTQFTQDLLTQGELISMGFTNLSDLMKAQVLSGTYNTNELTAMHQTMRANRLDEITEKQRSIMQQINSYADDAATAIGTLEAMGNTMVEEPNSKLISLSDNGLFKY